MQENQLEGVRLFNNQFKIHLMSISWFQCSIFEDRVELSATPPGKEPWNASFPWEKITKVCFRASDLYSSDVIRIYIGKESHYDIPLDAIGGYNLWDTIVEKGLFDEEVASELRFAENEIRCWPP